MELDRETAVRMSLEILCKVTMISSSWGWCLHIFHVGPPSNIRLGTNVIIEGDGENYTATIKFLVSYHTVNIKSVKVYIYISIGKC